ncbi:MAG: hypothetical protein ABSA14_11845 [Acidimicrobiales bacterium]
MPARGERVAIVACGTSYYMARAHAALREDADESETDAFVASELPAGRRYRGARRAGRTRDRDPYHCYYRERKPPIVRAARPVVLLDFADEDPVMQTRFITSVLVLLRAHLGSKTGPLIDDARRVIAATLPEGALELAVIRGVDPNHFRHLACSVTLADGSGPSIGRQ